VEMAYGMPVGAEQPLLNVIRDRFN